MAGPIWNDFATAGRCREVDTKIGSFFHFCQTNSSQKQYEGPTVKQSHLHRFRQYQDPAIAKCEKKRACISVRHPAPITIHAARSPKTSGRIYTNLLKGCRIPYWTRSHGAIVLRDTERPRQQFFLRDLLRPPYAAIPGIEAVQRFSEENGANTS